MPNGFHGPEDKWKQLEAPLPEIDEQLQSFAQSKKLTIEKNYHNWPSRLLQWENNGIQRQMQIYLENENKNTWNFWLCAYQDKDNTRYWKNEFLKKAVPFLEISKELENLLRNGFCAVESWSHNDLEKAK